MSKDFNISDLLKITEFNKYEAAVAGMEVINHLEQLQFPRKESNRKPAVKAMMALSDGMIKYDYIDDEARLKLEEELKDRARLQAQSALDGIFSTPGSSAPVADESTEDLDEIGETIPPDQFVEESASVDEGSGLPEAESVETEYEEPEDTDSESDAEEDEGEPE